jgi:hypothetical protein
MLFYVSLKRHIAIISRASANAKVNDKDGSGTQLSVFDMIETDDNEDLVPGGALFALLSAPSTHCPLLTLLTLL